MTSAMMLTTAAIMDATAATELITMLIINRFRSVRSLDAGVSTS